MYFNGHKFDPSSSLKYLGVLLDEHLSWNQHIFDLCCKLRRAYSALSKTRHYVPVDILLSVYHAALRRQSLVHWDFSIYLHSFAFAGTFVLVFCFFL